MGDDGWITEKEVIDGDAASEHEALESSCIERKGTRDWHTPKVCPITTCGTRPKSLVRLDFHLKASYPKLTKHQRDAMTKITVRVPLRRKVP